MLSGCLRSESSMPGFLFANSKCIRSGGQPEFMLSVERTPRRRLERGAELSEGYPTPESDMSAPSAEYCFEFPTADNNRHFFRKLHSLRTQSVSESVTTLLTFLHRRQIRSGKMHWR